MEDVAPTAIITPENKINNNDINNINNINNINGSRNKNNSINNSVILINPVEYKYLYQKKNFIIKISMTSDKKYLCIQSLEENNIINFYEINISFENLLKFDKYFKICDNIEEGYNSFSIILKNNNKNFIKEINNDKLILSIFILYLDGSYKEKHLELLKKKQNSNVLIEHLFQQIKELKEINANLEKELNNVKLENNKIKEDFTNFKNEMTKEINEIKNHIKKSNSISIDSKIINDINEFNFIIKRLKRINFNEDINENNVKKKYTLEFKLLYRASRDGDEAKNFHLKCDNYRNTLVIIETKKGLIFGGFTSQTWDGDGVDKKDKNAFCFSLDKKKIYNSIKGKNAIYACPDFGPAFENCIFEIKDKCFTYGGLCSDDSGKYFDNHEIECEINNGEEQFDVEDIEVFFVLFKESIVED